MSRGVQIAVLLLIVLVWIGSFFLSALNLGSKGTIGYMACFLSADVGYTFLRSHQLRDLYLGSFWLANIFMLASPFGLWRARVGKGLIFITLMALWDVLTLSYGVYSRVQHDVGTPLIGWFVWEAALVAMTLLLAMVRFSRRAA